MLRQRKNWANLGLTSGQLDENFKLPRTLEPAFCCLLLLATSAKRVSKYESRMYWLN